MRDESGKFKKGFSGNSGGRPHLEKELQKVKGLYAQEFKKIVARYCRMPLSKLQESFEDPKTKSLDLAVIKILIKTIKTGDSNGLNFLLDRTVGKVKEVRELQLPTPTIIVRPNGEQVVLGAEMPLLEGEVIDEDGGE